MTFSLCFCHATQNLRIRRQIKNNRTTTTTSSSTFKSPTASTFRTLSSVTPPLPILNLPATSVGGRDDVGDLIDTVVNGNIVGEGDKQPIDLANTIEQTHSILHESIFSVLFTELFVTDTGSTNGINSADNLVPSENTPPAVQEVQDVFDFSENENNNVDPSSNTQVSEIINDSIPSSDDHEMEKTPPPTFLELDTIDDESESSNNNLIDKPDLQNFWNDQDKYFGHYQGYAISVLHVVLGEFDEANTAATIITIPNDEQKGSSSSGFALTQMVDGRNQNLYELPVTLSMVLRIHFNDAFISNDQENMIDHYDKVFGNLLSNALQNTTDVLYVAHTDLGVLSGGNILILKEETHSSHQNSIYSGSGNRGTQNAVDSIHDSMIVQEQQQEQNYDDIVAVFDTRFIPVLNRILQYRKCFLSAYTSVENACDFFHGSHLNTHFVTFSISLYLKACDNGYNGKPIPTN